VTRFTFSTQNTFVWRLKDLLRRSGRRECSGSYHFNFVFIAVAGQYHFLLIVLAGALQGCPYSGTIFAVSIDPMLEWMQHDVVSNDTATVCACADDIGAALKDIKGLIPLNGIFGACSKATGLHLKEKKCMLVPTGCAFSPKIEDEVKSWLREFLPDWASFAVKEKGKYLGCWMSPAVTPEIQWKEASSKWLVRAKAVSSSEAAAPVAVPLYSSRCFSVLGYLAQLFEPTADMIVKERAVLHSLLKLPFNALDRHSLHRLDTVGAPVLPSVEVMATAARTRTALSTARTWQQGKAELEAAAPDFLPWLHVKQGYWWPKYLWQSPPIAATLADASEGLHAEPAVQDELQSLITTMKEEIEQDPNKKIKIQKRVTKHIFNLVHPDSLADTLSARMTKVLPGYEDDLQQAPWSTVFQDLKKIKGHLPLLLVRSWSNGWTTSARFHDGAFRHCLFGCKESDSLQHYWQCPQLWAWILEKSSLWSSDEPLERFGLVGPEEVRREAWVLMGIAYTTYHALRGRLKADMAKVDDLRYLENTARALIANATDDFDAVAKIQPKKSKQRGRKSTTSSLPASVQTSHAEEAEPEVRANAAHRSEAESVSSSAAASTAAALEH